MPIPFAGSVGSFPVTGFQYLSVTANVLLSSGTPVGSGIPTTPTLMTFHVLTGGGIAYIDPFGNTPSATSGIPIEVGPTGQISLNLANPSLARVISASTSVLTCWW